MAQPLSSNDNSWSAFPPSTLRAKRSKIQLACKNCRERKTRCDGGRPICAACMRRDVAHTCTYEQVSGPSRRYVTDLEDRLQRLEQEKQAEKSGDTDEQARRFPAAAQTSPPISTRDDVEATAPSNESLAFKEDNPMLERGPYQVDALATVASEDDQEHLYDNVAVSTPHRASSSYGSLHANPYAVLLPLEIVHGRTADDAAVLPFRHNADDYVNCYLEFVHPLFPLLHTTSFLASYQDLWLPHSEPLSNDGSLVFVSQVNLVFALGCQFSRYVASTQKAAAANEFYKRSQRVQLYDILGSSSIPVVQWLLLSGIYFQSTSRASHCWNSIGLAIRLAQGLGLHLEQPKQRAESQIDREMRKRIWHTCVVLDRLLAMTFGRPTMVNKAYNISVPLLIDDEYLRIEGEGRQPQNLPSRLGLFQSSCRLFEILADILSSFYGGNTSEQSKSQPSLKDMVSDVLNFNRRLDAFIVSIPDYLKTSHSAQIESNDKHGYINLQQQVLYCRFLYTRLLSLRPLLLMATDVPVAHTHEMQQADLSSLDHDIVKTCCSLCIRTAHYLVEAIHQHLDTTYKSTGWHSVYFTFASATILLASMKLPDMNGNGMENFEASWNRCLSILQHYQHQIQTAPYAIRVLKALRSQIEGQTNQTAHPERMATSTSTATIANDGTFRIPGQENSNNQIPSSLPPEVPSLLDFSQFNPYGVDDLSNAWFSQHIVNLDAMDFSDIDP